MLACRRAFAFVIHKRYQYEVSYVSDWSGQIANAMLLMGYVLQYSLFLCHDVRFNLFAKVRIIFELDEFIISVIIRIRPNCRNRVSLRRRDGIDCQSPDCTPFVWGY